MSEPSAEGVAVLRSGLAATQWLDPMRGGLPRVPARETLPTAVADLAGVLIYIPGTPDEAYFCGRNGAGTYVWKRMYLNDGDKGDITVTGDGATWNIDAGAVGTAELAADAVTSAKILDGTIATGDIADDAVTFAKTQNIATSRILGRTTAASGNIEELTVSSPLSLTAGALSLATGDRGDITVSGGGATWDIDAGAVGTPEIADDAVTFAKMQNIATDRVLGRDTAASGNIEELTLGSGLAISGGALTLTGGAASHILFTTNSVEAGPSATTTETDLLSYTVPAGTMGSLSIIRVTLWGHWAQGATPASVRLRIKFGGTTWVDDTSIVGTASDLCPVNISIIVMSNGSTTSQNIGGYMMLGTTSGGTAGVLELGGDELRAFTPFVAESTVNTGSDQTLAITATLSDATAGNAFRMYASFSELIN